MSEEVISIRTRRYIFWILIIGIICLGIYLIYYIQTQSYMCLSNPYNYSINLLEEANNATVSCLLTIDKVGAKQILLTKEGFSEYIGSGFNNKNISMGNYSIPLY